MKGMVVAPQPIAANVGMRMFAAGGNAFDAAVAVAFAQGVVDPQMCGIGGWGSLNCFTADGQIYQMIDFYGKVPKKCPPDAFADRVISQNRSGGGYLVEGFDNQVGHRSVTVPGTVAGLYEAHQRYGRLPWQKVLEPAIDLAKNGFPVPMETYAMWVDPYVPGYVSMKEKLGWTPAARAIYLKENGELYEPGEILRQEDMGKTLTRIAVVGPDVFYRGDVAQAIHDDFQKHDGFLCLEDLQEYQPEIREPVRGTYRGYEITSNPPPGSGVQLIQMLNILEGFDLRSFDPWSPEYIDLLARVIKLAFRDRALYLGDPAFVEVPVQKLTSKEYAEELRDHIRQGKPIEVPTPAGLARDQESPNTTHVCAVDSEGNVVSCTHTLAMASGVVTPGLGFMYNNAMHLFNPFPGYPNSIAPGKRRITGMCPTILSKNGKPVLAVGAPGGTRIVSAVLHTIVNIVDFGMSPAEAVAHPRWHCEGEVLEIEPRLYWNVAEELQRRGWRHILRSRKSYDSFFARAHAILIDHERGTFHGGADPRAGGGIARWPL